MDSSSQLNITGSTLRTMTCWSLSSDIPGGVVAPTVVLGALLGRIYSLLLPVWPLDGTQGGHAWYSHGKQQATIDFPRGYGIAIIGNILLYSHGK